VSATTPGTPKEHVKTKVAQEFARAHLNALASSETNIVQDGSKNSVSLNEERENETKKKAGSSSWLQENLPKDLEALLLRSSRAKKRKHKGWATLKDLTLSS
jgi:hypothetical protein